MPKIDYRTDRVRAIGNTAFTEASKEELRALIALMELKGEIDSVEALAEAAKISVARCKSALAFWEESGVISPNDGRPLIIEEFEERLVRGEIDEVPATKVAESIRDEDLASMIDICASLMGQACLSNTDVKNITALYTQYSLAPDYVATMAAYLKSRGDLTVRKLCNEAIRLQGKGCDTTEALDAYIKDMEQTSGAEWEFRRVLGIYGRNLSISEKAYFKKWSDEFGYSVAVVSEAYDVAVLNTSNGRGDLRYMDTILTAWHEAGCKTVSECRQHSENEKAKRKAETPAAKKKQKTTPETPRYGEFDTNDAFMKALERSYGTKTEDN